MGKAKTIVDCEQNKVKTYEGQDKNVLWISKVVGWFMREATWQLLKHVEGER